MKTLFTLITVFFVATGYSQIADAVEAVGNLAGKPTIVHDPTSEAQLIKTLDEARKTYDGIKKQLELLEDAKKVMVKVNTYVREVSYVDEIRKIYDQTIDLNQRSLETAQRCKVFNDKYVVNLVSAMNNSLISFESTLNLINHLLEDDIFSMDDASRIDRLKTIRDETRDYRATAIYLNREINRYISVKFLEQLYTRAAPYSISKLKK